MKKRRIKTWVKVFLSIVIVSGIMVINYNMNNKAIKKCVSLGYSEQVCIENL